MDEAKKLPLKKVFTTHWVTEMVNPVTTPSDIDLYYREISTNGLYAAKEVVRPTNIPFSDLEVFTLHKTKVTIEVIE